MLHWRHYVFALSVVASVPPSVRSVSCLSLCENNERISMKFVGGAQYNEQIKRLDFGRNLNNNKGAARIREKIRIDINRFRRDVKQVLSPSKWIYRIPCGRLSWLPVSFILRVKYTLSYRIVFTLFTSQTKADTILSWFKDFTYGFRE